MSDDDKMRERLDRFELRYGWHADKDHGFLWISPFDAMAFAASERALEREEVLKQIESEEHWRCFHCGEVFDNTHDAQMHFGDTVLAKAACTVEVEELRRLEAELARYRAEDSDLDRKYHAMEADHAVALRREEEKGYARGLADARAELLARASEGAALGFAKAEAFARSQARSGFINDQAICAELDRRAAVIAAQAGRIEELQRVTRVKPPADEQEIALSELIVFLADPARSITEIKETLALVRAQLQDAITDERVEGNSK